MGQTHQDCSEHLELEHQLKNHLQSVFGSQGMGWCQVAVIDMQCPLSTCSRQTVLGEQDLYCMCVAHDKPKSILDHCDWVVTAKTRANARSTDKPLTVLLLHAMVAKAVTPLCYHCMLLPLLLPSGNGHSANSCMILDSIKLAQRRCHKCYMYMLAG